VAAGRVGALSANGTVVRARVADQIIDSLRDRILVGTYARGSRLPTERELADEFGVSAPTIRESLRALTSLGLVEVRHGSGAYVRTSSDGILDGPLTMLMQLEGVGIEEIMGLIQALSLHAADLAIDAATADDIARVCDAAERTSQCQTLEDVQDAVPTFLIALSEASHQPLLAALCHFLTTMLVGLETSSYKRRSAAFWRGWAKDTAPLRVTIGAALERRDRPALKAAVTQLHDGVRERVRAVPALRTARLSDPALSPFVRQLVFGGLTP